MALDVTAARARVAAGAPALDPAALDLDWSVVREGARAACRRLVREHPGFAGLDAELARVSDRELRDLARAHLQDASCGGALGFVLAAGLRPSLHAAADALAAVLAEASPRRRCPLCGGPPDFAELTRAGERRLLCARCDTEWRWQRIGCPHCGNEASDALAYFETGEDGMYRLYVCERCKRYLKTIDLSRRWPERPLPVERALTNGMDVAALREGYRAA